MGVSASPRILIAWHGMAWILSLTFDKYNINKEDEEILKTDTYPTTRRK